MNQYISLVILLVVVVAFWISRKGLGTAGGVKISPSDAKRRLESEKGIILLDVRTKDEYLEKHIPKSTLIPVDVLSSEANKKLPDKNTEIFVYCRSGSRSAIAAKVLTKMGYTHIYNLGGIVRWPYETVSGNK
ncbi:rhodanese-like domain-containing protein [Petroclostridium sp. X23]|uniref:rhodanese-like domain-containing protein n=1 Tax=Petroclostridium sp. X23 TaxID=3045146 RepID=UPI0024AC85E3|nr:rhodanese-like domain-containing protein [Petroclostridium sp. X23]WHH57716.1 rhodanese-like domain-containing protein [Petroclostridium sp. X23]